MEYDLNFKKYIDNKPNFKSDEEELEFVKKTFTDEESYKIGWVPFLIAECGFFFARRAKDFCINKNYEEYKKTSRKLNHIEKDYDLFFKNMIDTKFLRKRIKEFFYRFDDERIKLEINAINVILKQCPDEKNMGIIKNALIAKGFIDLFDDYNNDINKMIIQRVGHPGYIEPKYLNELRCVLNEYLKSASVIVCKSDYNLNLCFNSIKNKIIAAEYKIVK